MSISATDMAVYRRSAQQRHQAAQQALHPPVYNTPSSTREKLSMSSKNLVLAGRINQNLQDM